MPLESHSGLYSIEIECYVQELGTDAGLSSVDLSLMPVSGRTMKCRVTA